MAKNSKADTGELSPPLKWAGGKRWLIPSLQPIWEGHRQRRLVEPFCGALAVTLGLMPKRACLGDISPHLMNLYRWLRDGLKVEPPYTNEQDNDSEAYYLRRERFNSLIAAGEIDTPEAAHLFYYLNRTGFNGLCRFNSKGLFNVPFGSYKCINYRNDFGEYQEAFRQWDFFVGDFQSLAVEPEDFIYSDPPYDVEFTRYAKEDFSWEDQERLAHWLAGHPGPVAASNQATDRICTLYEGLGFELRFLDAPRRISCNGNRATAKEVLALKGV